MKAAAIIAVLVLLILAPSAAAEEVEQRAVVVLPSPNPDSSLAFIVDARNGYLREWCGGVINRLHYQG